MISSSFFKFSFIFPFKFFISFLYPSIFSSLFFISFLSIFLFSSSDSSFIFFVLSSFFMSLFLFSLLDFLFSFSIALSMAFCKFFTSCMFLFIFISLFLASLYNFKPSIPFHSSISASFKLSSIFSCMSLHFLSIFSLYCCSDPWLIVLSSFLLLSISSTSFLNSSTWFLIFSIFFCKIISPLFFISLLM